MQDLIKVQGSYPEKFESLRGGTFINIEPSKIESEDNDELYEYYQIFTMETNEEILENLYIKALCKVKQVYLDDTDHKDFPRYVPKPDEDMEAIYTKREEAREFIRMNR